VLDELADRFDERRSRQFPELCQLVVGIDSRGQHGNDEPALRRGVRLAWDHPAIMPPPAAERHGPIAPAER
jgi:hypothetical protein